MRPRRGLLESWRERSAGEVGGDVVCEYAVREAKRGEHAEMIVDGMNEADLFVRSIAKAPVGKFSMWASREHPDEPTAFAFAGKNVCWRCLARTSTGTDMNARSN